MVDLEVDISRSGRTPKELDRAIERLCRESGLTVTMKATLAKYPGAIHWHVKRGRDRGTLEVTLWPEKSRLWFSMQGGRTGDWVMETARQFKDQLEVE